MRSVFGRFSSSTAIAVLMLIPLILMSAEARAQEGGRTWQTSLPQAREAASERGLLLVLLVRVDDTRSRALERELDLSVLPQDVTPVVVHSGMEVDPDVEGAWEVARRYGFELRHGPGVVVIDADGHRLGPVHRPTSGVLRRAIEAARVAQQDFDSLRESMADADAPWSGSVEFLDALAERCAWDDLRRLLSNSPPSLTRDKRLLRALVRTGADERAVELRREMVKRYPDAADRHWWRVANVDRGYDLSSPDRARETLPRVVAELRALAERAHGEGDVDTMALAKARLARRLVQSPGSSSQDAEQVVEGLTDVARDPAVQAEVRLARVAALSVNAFSDVKRRERAIEAMEEFLDHHPDHIESEGIRSTLRVYRSM